MRSFRLEIFEIDFINFKIFLSIFKKLLSDNRSAVAIITERRVRETELGIRLMVIYSTIAEPTDCAPRSSSQSFESDLD